MLHSAAQAASPLAVEKLLQFDKSQLESVDKFGNSPYVDLARSLALRLLTAYHSRALSIDRLHIAAQRGNIHTIEVLLRARASIDATTMVRGAMRVSVCASS